MENNKKVYCGIDCDPFCRYQEDFQKKAETVLGREIKAISKFFGCWEYKEEMTSDLRRVSQKINKAKMTSSEYALHGKYSKKIRL